VKKAGVAVAVVKRAMLCWQSGDSMVEVQVIEGAQLGAVRTAYAIEESRYGECKRIEPDRRDAQCARIRCFGSSFKPVWQAAQSLRQSAVLQV